MNTSIVLVAVAILVFFVIVFLVVNAIGTRLTGKQIEEDPDVRRHVDPSQRDEEFPVDSEF